MLVIIIVNKDIHSILKIRFPSEDLKVWLCRADIKPRY